MVTIEQGSFDRDPRTSAQGIWKAKGPIPNQGFENTGSLINTAVSEQIDELLEQGVITNEQIQDTRRELREERKATLQGRR